MHQCILNQRAIYKLCTPYPTIFSMEHTRHLITIGICEDFAVSAYYSNCGTFTAQC